MLSLHWDIQPRQMWVKDTSIQKPTPEEKRLRRLQQELIKTNVPLYWNSDCGWDTEWFTPVQFVCSLGIIQPDGMAFKPKEILSTEEIDKITAKLGDSDWFLKAIEGKQITRGQAAEILYDELIKRFDLLAE